MISTLSSTHRRVTLALVLLGGAALCSAQNPSPTPSSNRPSSANPSNQGGTYNQSTSATSNNPNPYGTPATSRTAASGDKLSWTDRRFVSKTADSGHDEVQLAQLAAQRATNPEVRQFAEQLVKDHTAVNDELKQIASSKHVKIDADDGKERAYRRLNGKSGAEFDQEFVEHMVDSHEDGIRRFEKAAKDAKDPEIRSFAARHVDHLRQHLQQAQRLQASSMPTGRVDANAPTSPQANGTTSTINSGANSTSPSSSTTPATPSTNTGGANPNSPNQNRY